MKKILTFTFFLLFQCLVFSQSDEIQKTLKNVTRDSLDKKCEVLFTDFYDSFKSNEGQANPKMITATINLFKYQNDTTVENKHLAILLMKYINSVSEPEKALIYIQALREEYPKVYGHMHPLILLYQGESLINAGRKSDAYKHFIEFQKEYPNSIMAMVYIYETETDKNLSLTWLSVLKKLYPEHWVVKDIK